MTGHAAARELTRFAGWLAVPMGDTPQDAIAPNTRNHAADYLTKITVPVAGCSAWNSTAATAKPVGKVGVIVAGEGTCW